MSLMSHKFPKSSRLLNAGDYSLVFNKTTARAAAGEGTVIGIKSDQPDSRLGIIVAKKNVKLAAQRNRVKRIVRDYFRRHPLAQPMDIVFLARKGVAERTNQDLCSDLSKIWRKLDQQQK